MLHSVSYTKTLLSSWEVCAKAVTHIELRVMRTRNLTPFVLRHYLWRTSEFLQAECCSSHCTVAAPCPLSRHLLHPDLTIVMPGEGRARLCATASYLGWA